MEEVKAPAVQTVEKVKKTSRLKETCKQLWRNPKAMFGLVILVIYVIISIFGNQIAPYKPSAMSAQILAKPFTAGHIFGTDHLGRDLFSRVIIGTRYSMCLGLGATIISTIIGVILGAMSGYFGGVFDEVMMRILDVIQSVPGVLLNMALATAFGSGFWNLMLALAVSGITGPIRLERSCILSIRKLEYIDAASSINCSTSRKILKHIIPNAFSPCLVQATMNVGGTIMSAAGLSFLGCGMPLSTPEWGALLSGGRDYIKNAPYLCIIPGIMLIFFVLAVNLFGDGLRDALDPKQKR